MAGIWRVPRGNFEEKTEESNGGEGGIRTPGTVPRTLDFESSAFNRARPPLRFWNRAFVLSGVRKIHLVRKLTPVRASLRSLAIGD